MLTQYQPTTQVGKFKQIPIVKKGRQDGESVRIDISWGHVVNVATETIPDIAVAAGQ